MNRPRIGVLGAGAWGTALAIHAVRAGCATTLWARDPERAAAMQARRENPRLPGAVLPDALAVVAAMPAADILLVAVPVQHLRPLLARLPASGDVVICAKGVEAGTTRLPLEILAALWPGRSGCLLTGPNFAAEIAAGLPAAAVVAGGDAAQRGRVIAALGTPALRLYGNDDVVGAQLGGAAKNVVAIAAGIVIGAGLGQNARAALVTRGLAELARLAVALGGRAETVAGLSGLGDLLLTCTGGASRNLAVGIALGEGRPLDDLPAPGEAVAEGVATAPALHARGLAAGMELPICGAVAAVVTGRWNVTEAIHALQSRDRRDE